MTRTPSAKSLGKVVELVMGQAPSSKDCNVEGRGTPFVKVGEFGEVRPVIREWTTNPLRMARKTDVLLCVVGATCGKINLGEDCAIGRSVAAIRPNDSVVNQFYLHYFMMTLVERLRSGSIGAAQTVISKDMVASVKIPLPPLPEQRRIVGILDEAFAGIAAAKANTEKNLQNARALFENDLRSVFVNDRYGWVKSNLKTVTTKIGSGATPRGGEQCYKSEGVSLIRSLNVHDLGFKYRKLAFLDDAQAEELANVEVRPRDVLLNITGASVARSCLAPADVFPARVNQHVAIIRPVSEKLDASFLHYLLISKPYKDRLLGTSADNGATRQAITKAQIQEFDVSFPAELNEQKSIVAKLNATLAETQKLERLYQQKLAALDDLKKSLLHEAFTGQL